MTQMAGVQPVETLMTKKRSSEWLQAVRGCYLLKVFYLAWERSECVCVYIYIASISIFVIVIVFCVSNFNRLVAEISMERKMKSQKTKNKPSEVKKQQLSSVRVIQRNLVYIVGLPLNLGDEDVLSVSFSVSVYVSLSMCVCGSVHMHRCRACGCLSALVQCVLNILWHCSAASSAQRIFQPVWEGSKSIYVSYCCWCHSAISKQYL